MCRMRSCVFSSPHSERNASSSSSSILAESIRLGTAPLAILLADPDEILVLGALVAQYLYRRTCPIVVLPDRFPGAVATGDQVEVQGDRITLIRPRGRPGVEERDPGRPGPARGWFEDPGRPPDEAQR